MNSPFPEIVGAVTDLIDDETGHFAEGSFADAR